LTKGALRLLTEQIAYGLRTHYGIGAQGPYKDVVTIMSSGQPLVPAVFYGIIAAGGVVSTASHSFTPQELARQIEQGGSSVMVCSVDLKNVAVEAAKICGMSPDRVVVMDSYAPWILLSSEGSTMLRSEHRLTWTKVTDRGELERSLIVLLYSSGTTGTPKGVMLSDLNLVAEIFIPMMQTREWAETNVPEGTPPTEMRTLAHLPIAHIAGVIGYLTVPVLMGATVYWMRKFEWKSFLEYSKKYRVTTMYTVPSIYLRIAKSPEVTDQFQTVEAASTGAALMDEDLQKAANAKLGNGTVFIGQTWGLSETTGAVTAMPKGQTDDTGSISPVLPNIQLRSVPLPY